MVTDEANLRAAGIASPKASSSPSSPTQEPSGSPSSLSSPSIPSSRTEDQKPTKAEFFALATSTENLDQVVNHGLQRMRTNALPVPIVISHAFPQRLKKRLRTHFTKDAKSQWKVKDTRRIMLVLRRNMRGEDELCFQINNPHNKGDPQEDCAGNNYLKQDVPLSAVSVAWLEGNPCALDMHLCGEFSAAKRYVFQFATVSDAEFWYSLFNTASPSLSAEKLTAYGSIQHMVNPAYDHYSL